MISIQAQIQEVEYELKMRRQVYPGLIHKNPRRESELNLHVQRMEAVLETLRQKQAELVGNAALL